MSSSCSLKATFDDPDDDMTAVLPPLDGQLCFALYGASMAMTRVYKPMLDRFGLTYPQYLVLHALWEQDGRTIGAIATRLSLESSTITPLVKRLEASGLVTRQRDAANERQVRVHLSPHGQARRHDGACVADAVFRETGLTLDEVAELTARLRRLRQALAKDIDDV